MKAYIDKSALVAEIERRIKVYQENFDKADKTAKLFADGLIQGLESFLAFLDTFEVKEVYECNDVDLNPLFEEMGVEPDSRIALMFKNAFYKAVDNYLDRKENNL